MGGAKATRGKRRFNLNKPPRPGGGGGRGKRKEGGPELLDDLNRALAKASARKETIEVTPAAVAGLRAIALQEKRSGQGLAVIVDEGGSFCLEFRAAPEAGDRAFVFKGKPPVSVFVSPLVLRRIGGAVIDARDGGFKLDLPEDADLAAPGSIGCI